MKKICFCMTLLLFASFFAGCGGTQNDPGKTQPRLVVYCAISSPRLESLINEFEKQYDVRIDLIAGSAVSYPEDAGEADVFMGIAPQVAEENPAKFRLYSSANAQDIVSAYRRVEDSVTTFATGATVLLVNTNLAGDIPIRGYRDLLNPDLSGQVTMPNPHYSGAGFRHLMNMLAAFSSEEDGWLFVRSLIGNRLMRPVASDQEAAEAVAHGRTTAAMTTEAAARTEVLAGSPVRIVYMREGVLPYELGVSAATLSPVHREAEFFVDFLTSRATQVVLARQFHFRSVHKDVRDAEKPPRPDDVRFLRVPSPNAERRRHMLERFDAYAFAAEEEP